MSKMPKQKPGNSRQDYGTPREVIDAIERRFGKVGFDLAASKENAIVPAYFDEQRDGLAQSWELPGVRVAWLNPPFANIRPWAQKCESVRWLPRWTIMLVPASMGSMWWRDHVLNKCQADGVPRITFVGEKIGYPKDLAILAYGFGVSGTGFWDYRDWISAAPTPPLVAPPKRQRRALKAAA